MNRYIVHLDEARHEPIEADDFSAYDGTLTFANYDIHTKRNEDFMAIAKGQWLRVELMK